MKKLNISRKTGTSFYYRLSIAALLIVLMLLVSSCGSRYENKTKGLEKAKVTLGNLSAVISATGVVEPYNRIEIKAPVAGRIEEVLVDEGDRVKKGEILAWMSSSDRAALLDAARAKGANELRYWESVYKPAPIVAPIDGFIIDRNILSGQSVMVTDAVLVEADKLIVKAQIDETDLGSIRLGQRVNIVLDAYPENPVSGKVDKIAYESQLISNVNIYYVDVIPDRVPDFFRSGMSATANFMLNERQNVLILPSKAVKKQNGISYVFIKGKGGKIEALQIKTGMESSDSIEIISGISKEAEVIIPTSQILKETIQRPRMPGFNIFGGQRR